MAPIFTPDGSEVSEVILPDGASANEVVAPDGRTVFGGIPDSVVSREQDDSTVDRSSKNGLIIDPLVDWPSIGARISNNTSGVTTAYLRDDADESLIESVDISGLSAGDAFTFNDVNLDANKKYQILLDADGASYTVGFSSQENYPYTTPDIEIEARYLDGSRDTGDGGVNVNDVGNVGLN